MLEAVLEAEAVAQRRGQQPGAGGGADQRERRQLERDDARAGARADRDRELAVLHRGIERLLDRARQPVDLVDEEHRRAARARSGRRRCRPCARAPGRRSGRSRPRARRPRSARARSCRARAGRRAARGRAPRRARRRPGSRRRAGPSAPPGRRTRRAGAGAARRRAASSSRATRRASGCGRRTSPPRDSLSAWAIRSSGVWPGAPSSSSSASWAEKPRPTRPSRASSRGSSPRATMIGSPAGAAPTFSRSSTTIRSAVRLPTPWHGLQPRGVAGGDGGEQLARRAAAEDRERHLRPDRLDADQQQEEVALGLGGEAVEQQRVVTHDQVRVERRRLARGGHLAQRLGRHREPVADAAAGDDDVVGPPDGDLAARAIMRATLARAPPARRCLVRERAAHRRGVGVADRDGERVGGVVGPRQLLEREQRLDHPLDLVLGGAAGAADRALDLLRRVGPARDARAGRPPAARPRAPGRPRAPSARWRRSRAPPPPPPRAGARRAARRRGRGSRASRAAGSLAGEVWTTPPSSATIRPPWRATTP